MSGKGKVLTGLMERRALEAAFSELAEITSPALVAERAQEIAQQGSAALPVLLSLCDTTDPQLRGGLGQVAARLERDEVVSALRQVVRSRDRTDQARLTALTILDRFLDESVDDALLAGLQDADAVAQQSLRELMHAMARNPFAVIEYLNQLAEQPPEVARMILAAIPLVSPDSRLVTLLRMFAQGEDVALAQAALEQLGRTRSSDALVALRGLLATLPPPQAALAERGLRKLRLSGARDPRPDDIGVAASESSHWRALLSPIDGTGHQVLWFISKPDGEDQGTLFSVLTRDPVGITASFGSREVPGNTLPPAQPVGHVHVVAGSDSTTPIMLLEVPFDAGRQVVREALELNWSAGNPTPLEYRLLNVMLWSSDFCSDPGLLPAPQAGLYTPSQSAALLDHPLFLNWFWQGPELSEIARELAAEPGPTTQITRIAALANAWFGPEVVASYQRRLRNMARWLALASQPEVAALAQAAAEQLETGPPAESPFMLRLISIGLEVAIVNLRTENSF